jgi:hypothetical protein
LYSLRDGLIQISWLCEVLEKYEEVHKEMMIGEEGAEERQWEILEGILERLPTRYTGLRAKRDIFKCYDVVSDDMRTFADVNMRQYNLPVCVNCSRTKVRGCTPCVTG